MYLGSENSAIDLEYLRKHNIDRIVIAAMYCDKHFRDEDGIKYMVLDIDDSPDEDIQKHFDSVIDFIQAKDDTNVLVHCISGISRSATCVIAYVMKTCKMSY